MEWQPIETAPKDGSPVLGFVNKDWIEGFFYSDGRWNWLSDGDGPLNKRDYPTHWMPLPPPPEGK